MMMTEDRIRVLEMLREGKISPEAAAELLDAMSGNVDVEGDAEAEDAEAEDAAAKDAAAKDAAAEEAEAEKVEAASFEYAEQGMHAGHLEPVLPFEPDAPVEPAAPVAPVGPEEPVMPFEAVEEQSAASGDGDAAVYEQDAFSGDRSAYPTDAEKMVPPPSSGKTPHWLRVKVTDMASGRPRVNLRVPIGLIGMGMKIGAHFSPEVREIDPALVMQAFREGEIGPFVDVYDDEGGEHVEISLE